MPGSRLEMPTILRRDNSGSRNIIEIAETFGIEYETDNLTPNDLADHFRDYFRTTHDASIETDVLITNDGLLLDRNSNEHALQFIGGRSNITIGTEIVSLVLRSSDENLLELLKKLTNFLGECGETSESLRSGIHLHFSLPNPNLSMLKAIIKLGVNLEALFYTLGGMGYNFRGEKNDSVFCRPITKNGPPCVYYSKGMAQVFNINDLLNSRTSSEFWERYGDPNNHNDRYSPVRYTWLNLFPMCPYSGDYKGTLEFRVFNKTLNPHYIYAIIQLCKKFTEFVVANYRDLKIHEYLQENSIFDDIDEKRIEELFYATVRVLGVEDNIAYILDNILKSSPIPKLPNEYVASHILGRRSLNNYWSNGNYMPTIIPASSVKTPHFTDIHTLRGE